MENKEKELTESDANILDIAKEALLTDNPIVLDRLSKLFSSKSETAWRLLETKSSVKNQSK